MKYQYYFVPDFINRTEIELLNEVVSDPTVGSSEKLIEGKNFVKSANVKTIQHSFLWDQLDHLRNIILLTNKENFGFDLFEISKFSSINYNQYSETDQGQYTWHCDAEFNQCYDLKLTAILNISTEPVEGGDFSLFLGGELPIHGINNPGSLLIFPSWVQHSVKPVTKGVRKTISMWVSGPNWK
jgi:PKHD-type hydroxylase